MTRPLTVVVSGIGAWSPRHAGWPALRDALLGTSEAASNGTNDATNDGGGTATARRPAPLLLPAAERRRVPDGVAVALEVAREALAGAGRIDTAALASVFASAHGELAIVDYLCATLADDPLLLSPTRFHHSVHNAAAGYWSIATPSLGPSTSLAAGDDSVALGLLETVAQVVAEARPVLLVVFDTPGVGLLATAVANTALFGAALLLTPVDVEDDAPRLSICVAPRAATAPLPAAASLQSLATSSPAARVVALLGALASADGGTVDYPMGSASTISVQVLRCRAEPRTALRGAIE